MFYLSAAAWVYYQSARSRRLDRCASAPILASELMLPFAPEINEALESETTRRPVDSSTVSPTGAGGVGQTSAGNRRSIWNFAFVSRRISTAGAVDCEQQFNLRSVAIVAGAREAVRPVLRSCARASYVGASDHTLSLSRRSALFCDAGCDW